MIKTAKSTLPILENILVEKKINHDFNPTSWNETCLKTAISTLAEKHNYINKLEALLQKTEPKVVTNEEIEQTFVAMLA